ncbi:hypothetical protein PSECIP111951_00048 [Pseudoalteromonas holothuriae]|uniref:ADP ribosyltransferase domain-containing protein n=1 Tax=Pseudoalteromonas holothuriae TaxID=2963714 RepID=A0ABM9GF56_9GAMM|nr:ADP-ribosyltransferase [Pseudoalteromonas sp. CIP111951]CAH9049833.1 hypothetical protein PSECIP111951_00048 [Pseudoalteromonas sp. CIP111951]
MIKSILITSLLILCTVNAYAIGTQTKIIDEKPFTYASDLSEEAKTELFKRFTNTTAVVDKSAADFAYINDVLAYEESGVAAATLAEYQNSFPEASRLFGRLINQSKSAIARYTRDFTAINNYARTGIATGADDFVADLADTQMYMNNLDTGLKHLPRYTGTSYRYTRDFGIGRKLTSGEIKVGDVVADKAYQSTSSNLNFMNSSKAEQFYGSADDLVFYEIEGVNGRFLPTNFTAYGPAKNQFEVLFPRNTAFKIDGYSQFKKVMTSGGVARERVVTYIKVSEVESDPEVMESALTSHSGELINAVSCIE